jgi:hypothetical protein
MSWFQGVNGNKFTSGLLQTCMSPPSKPRHRLLSFKQHLLAQAFVTASGGDVGMVQQLLRFVKAAPRVDQEAGKAIP